MLFLGKSKFIQRVRPLAFCVPVALAASLCNGAEEVVSEEVREVSRIAASAIPPDMAKGSLSAIAGEFGFGNGFDINCNLEIYADGRFSYSRWNCDKKMEHTTGVVTLEHNRFVLHSERFAVGPHFPGTGNTLIPVPWGQRLYLIPDNDLLGFCNQINRGIEPITHGTKGSYFLREGDWDRDVAGKPELPEEWKQYVLDVVPPGTIIGKDPSGRWIINLGVSHKMFLGLEMTAFSPDGRKFLPIQITEVGQDSCAVQVIPQLSKKQSEIQNWTVRNPRQPMIPVVVQPQTIGLRQTPPAPSADDSDSVPVMFAPE